MKTHTVTRQIKWGDLDSLEIVYYPRYYEWLDACGHLFFKSIGLNLNDLWKKRHIQFILVETSCRYSRPGRYHDEIEIVTQIDELRTKAVRFKYVILRADDHRRMAVGYEKRVCADVSDPSHFKVIPLPEDIYALLEDAMR